MRKTTKSRKSTAVQGTNDSSSVSKSSMVYTGYFNDDFIKYFVKKRTNGLPFVRSPLINRGYYIRNYILNKIIVDFINYCNNFNTTCQIVSIGSGFDSTYFRLKQQNLILPGNLYIEVDFPELQRKKLSLMKETDELWEHIGETIHLDDAILWNSCNYKMIGCDLTETSELLKLLVKAGVELQMPTLILSEVVLTYLDVEKASSFISWTSQTFKNASFVTYEQIHPFDEFGEFMCKHFLKLGSPLKSICNFPTTESQVERYLNQGWKVCSASTMTNFYLNMLPNHERNRMEKLEMFDEHEEWFLKLNHYFVLVASQGCCRSMNPLGFCPPNDVINQRNLSDSFINRPQSQHLESLERFASESNLEENGKQVVEVELVDLNCSRYGHSSCVLNEHLLVLGGFGDAKVDRVVSNGTTNEDHSSSKINHCRSRQANIFQLFLKPSKGHPSIQTNHNHPSKSSSILKSSQLFERMHASCTPLKDGKILIIGGRKAPDRPRKSVILLEVGFHPEVHLEQMHVASLNGSQNLIFHDEDTNFLDEKQDKISGPVARWRHSATAVTLSDHDLKEQVFIHGGMDGKKKALDDTWCLDTSNWSWISVPVSSNSPGHLHSHSSDWWNKGHALVVSGGMNDNGQISNSIHLLDLKSYKWMRLKTSGQLEARFSHTSHIQGDCLIMVGGVATCHLSPVVSNINLVTGVVSNIQVRCDVNGMTTSPYEFHKHTSHMLKGDDDYTQIIVIGGGGNYFSFGTKIRRGGLLLKILNK